MSDAKDNIPPWMQGWTSSEEQARRDAAFKEEESARKSARINTRSMQAMSERNRNDIKRYDRIAKYAQQLADEWRESDRLP